jgi:hypothetical protein
MQRASLNGLLQSAVNVRIIKPAYVWALGITTLLTMWALVFPAREPMLIVAKVQRESRPASSSEPLTSVPSAAATVESSASSMRGDRAEIAAAQVDIFADRRRLPVADIPPALPSQPVAPQELVGPSLPPPPPLLNIQFAGRFRTPDGRAMVYLRDGERFVVAKVGDTVSSGYQITALLGDGQRVLKPDDNAERIAALRFQHAPSRHTEILMLPPEAAAP